MLQVPFIRENKDLVIERLKKRNIDAAKVVEEVIELDNSRRSIQTKLDNTLAESNALSKDIGNLFKSGEVQKANLLKGECFTAPLNCHQWIRISFWRDIWLAPNLSGIKMVSGEYL